MSRVLPSQRLTIGELFVSIAVGLMFFLLPNDAQNQLDSSALGEGMVFVATVLITAVLLFFIKRYEAVGAAMLTMAVMEVISTVYSIIVEIFSSTKDYWPSLSQYQIITMFILWSVPFFIVVTSRMLLHPPRDTNDRRKGFVRFLSLSLRALFIIYILVVVFNMIIPQEPSVTAERQIDVVIFDRIGQCLNGQHKNGFLYILWHCLILMPLTFGLLIVNPKIRWWHLMIISVAVGVTIELIQFSLNSASACIDDLMMYLIGAGIGIGLKHLIDYLRSVISMHEDTVMLSLDYTPIKRQKEKNVPIILTEE